ncbi:TetR/AcrR family transcriptional regulator [Planosporangium flavigriseum]|uniref:TetR family transcriptional regulator n=1 Tax=Planosporangium flavigriseum TaxID=373681 RepID=A0A8J3LQ36_9ACTN|nr:TetR/AcrR family transcriptional regulator [Planosporangium flavigriseum]NJC65076.1 TetR/AcrR family transcriptional regulator [Planosporangium flavigriseum]GIG71691.1 TetR family transcriptional regulator [Planosporangium flavigriseum]
MKETADTRTRIQDVALELFTEQGYEATSLREIAERLGVTKAALYYHFKTKEDIVTSMFESRVAVMDELIAWGQAQPKTPETRREFVRRYAADLQKGRHHQTMRFFERNQTAMRDNPAGEKVRERMAAMLDILTDKDAPLTDQLRSALAIFAMHATWFVFRQPEVTDEQRQEAGLQVALEMIGD